MKYRNDLILLVYKCVFLNCAVGTKLCNELTASTHLEQTETVLMLYRRKGSISIPTETLMKAMF